MTAMHALDQATRLGGDPSDARRTARTSDAY